MSDEWCGDVSDGGERFARRASLSAQPRGPRAPRGDPDLAALPDSVSSVISV